MSLTEVAAWCISATPSLQLHSFIIRLTLIIHQAAVQGPSFWELVLQFTKGQINQPRSGSTLVFFHFKKHAALAVGLIRAPWESLRRVRRWKQAESERSWRHLSDGTPCPTAGRTEFAETAGSFSSSERTFPQLIYG